MGAPNMRVGGLAIAHNSSQKLVPVTGQTIALSANGLLTAISVEPAGNLSALTMTIDDGVADGQVIVLSFYALVSTMTFQGANIDVSGITYGPAIGPKEVVVFAWFAAPAQWKALVHSSGQ